MYPIVAVHGSPRERGRQYGEQARRQVGLSIAAYRDVFMHYATWDWPTVLTEARRFREPIRAFGEAYYEEILGIAEGAGVDPDEILAVNVRTEIMYAAKARASGAQLPRVAECSAVASIRGDGRTVIGQNWDWLPHAFDTTVILESAPSDGPRFVTVVEAGLLAKTGFNSAGLAVCTNALVSAEDRGAPGVPYHVLLRALLDATTPTHALETLQRGTRSSSANYLVAHADGIALDVEAAPGGFTDLHLIAPDPQGTIVHTNHFLSPLPRGFDLSVWAMPDSPFRLQRIRAAAARLSDQAVVDQLQTAFADHAGHPYGVCTHPDPALPAQEQGATVASLVMDLGSRTLHVCCGNPCRVPYDVLDYTDFFATAAPTDQRGGGELVQTE